RCLARICPKTADAPRADYGNYEFARLAHACCFFVRAGLLHRRVGHPPAERIAVMRINPKGLLKIYFMRGNAISLFLIIFLALSLHAQTNDHRSLILVIGNPGDSDYAEQFSTCADLWKQAAAKGGLSVTVIGKDEPRDDRTRLLKALSDESCKSDG